MRQSQLLIQTSQKSSQADVSIIKKLESQVGNFNDVISALNEELESLTKSNQELASKLQASQSESNQKSRQLLEQKDQSSKLEAELAQEAQNSSAMVSAIHDQDTTSKNLTKQLATVKEQ